MPCLFFIAGEYFVSEIQNKMDLQLVICVYELVCAMIKNPRRMDLITFGKRIQQLFLFHSAFPQAVLG